jgi:hypothetical protein
MAINLLVGVGVQIWRVRHRDVLVHAIERNSGAGHGVENQRRARRNPDGIVGESTPESVPRGIRGSEAVTLVEVPERH